MNILQFIIAMVIYGLTILWLTFFLSRPRLDVLAMMGIVFATASFIYFLVKGII
jgi:hypothetical protein